MDINKLSIPPYVLIRQIRNTCIDNLVDINKLSIHGIDNVLLDGWILTNYQYTVLIIC